MSQLSSFLRNKQGVTFLDLFAGAGGFSEGLLQACSNNKYFDFILASDINENCELTHRVRYNDQLGLKTKFLTEDIMSENFLTRLKKEIGNTVIDVVTGGPSCQSFSLSGRRKKFDKRDDLFQHYLKVIRMLRPKYFVMENVKGILTKDAGKFKERIVQQIRSIVDDSKTDLLYSYLSTLLSRRASSFQKDCIMAKVKMEIDDAHYEKHLETFFNALDAQYKVLTKVVDYRKSKSDCSINTIRHGLNLLRRSKQRESIKASIINEKTIANIDNDVFGSSINDFIEFISDGSIIERIFDAFNSVSEFFKCKEDAGQMKEMIEFYSLSLDECFEKIMEFAKKDNSVDFYENVLNSVRLYNISKPIVVLSSDYGVPQNRERVLFIGCRNDQEIITDIPPTVVENEKTTIYEALFDLDFIGNGEKKKNYEPVPVPDKFKSLLKFRNPNGSVAPDSTRAKTYAEWSKNGRLTHRFKFETKPFYTKSMEDYRNGIKETDCKLFNHQTSFQNKDVQKRLDIIASCGEYDEKCKKKLKELGLESNKRNYSVLKADGQSPTVVTMPDDFIHYSKHRAMTCREMARLQSFDDSFVFQGKRATGGDKRKSEIPQYTLVGNAVPPLMAKAIGEVLLSKIK
ncbi:MAG: DNA cytosine methyltransferase [Fibrobacter sp.]|nr:DNA cytosine methyltransferase [Fibrobacter sp.]